MTRAESNALIRAHYPTGNLADLAAQCKCTIGALCQRAVKLEVYRTVGAMPVSQGYHCNKQVTFVSPGHMIHKST